MLSTRVRAASLAAAFIVLLPPSAWAQLDPRVAPGPRRVDVSGSGGFLVSTDWSDLVLLGSVSPATGALEQLLVRDLVVDPGPVFDATVTYWEGRYGMRVHAGFASSCLAVARRCGEVATLESGSSSVDLDAYIYNIGGAVGMMDYRPDAWVWPYVFLGIGGVTYNLEQGVSPPLQFVEHRRTIDGQTTRITDSPDQLLISIDELGLESKLAFNAGIGVDFRIPMGRTSLGVRLEVSDHVHDSPVSVEIANVEQFTGVSDTRVDFGYVHNFRLAAGVVVQLGR